LIAAASRDATHRGRTQPPETIVQQEQADEFYTVRKQAYQSLRHGTHPDGHPLHACQFLILPSFENAICWDITGVASRKQKSTATLHRSCWRMDVDAEAFRSPVVRIKYSRPYRPTIETGTAPLDIAKLDQTLSPLLHIRIPVMVPKSGFGIDGTRIEWFLGDFMYGFRLLWWCDLPEEWRELAPVIADLLGLMETTWADAHG